MRNAKNLDAGSTREVIRTTNLSGLTIADGAAIKSPEGCSVNMTVDGVKKAIKAGSYGDNIVLTVEKS